MIHPHSQESADDGVPLRYTYPVRIWCVVCTVLSGLLMAAIISLMHGCSASYFVGKGGALMQDGGAATYPQCPTCTPPPCKGHRNPPAVLSWEDALPEFAHLAPQFVEGDTLTYSWTSVYILEFLRMTELQVQRQGSPPRTYRHGFLLFWVLVVLISLTPLLLWSIAAMIIAMNAPRRAPPVSDRP